MSRFREITQVFFDLDHTLWDFEANSREALQDAFSLFDLSAKGISDFTSFFSVYRAINDRMWEQYRKGEISQHQLRIERFRHALLHYGVEDDVLAAALGKFYVQESPRRTHLFPGTHEILGYLSEKYSLHMITNGFEEVQFIKLECAALRPYFDVIVTSERAGAKKPHRDIFQYALKQTGGRPSESVMIGDNLEVDVLGAIQQGWQAIWFTQDAVTAGDVPVVRSLEELKRLL